MTPNVTLVQTWYENISLLLGALHPDIEWHEMQGIPYGGVYHGADAVMQNVFQHIAADWEDFGATPKTLLDAGDGCVVALGRYHGKFRPTGKTLDAEFAHIFYLEGKQLVKFHQYVDSALWNEVMS